MKLFLLYIPLGLLALLLFFMLRNRAYKVCPWFFGYVAFTVAATAARFAVHNHARAYFAVYWITDAGCCVLGILAMYEVFRVIIRYLTSRWWIHLIFPGVVIAGTGLSLARAHAVPPRVSGLLYYIVVGEIAVRFVEVLAVLLTVVPLFGFRRHRYALGIAAGFGFYSVVELLNTIKFADLGTTFKFWWNVISIGAYSIGVLIWIWFFRVPQEDVPLPTLQQVSVTDAPRQYPGRLRRLHPWLRAGAGL
ncbi:MAG: hypothetical protein WAN65_09990 [Candidatus Sulfotelmatobacter sp.]